MRFDYCSYNLIGGNINDLSPITESDYSMYEQTGGRGKKVIPPLDKDDLKPFGYHNVKELSDDARRKALKKAIQKYDALAVFRKLKALATLQKNQDKESSAIFDKDAKWIKTQKEWDNRKTAKKNQKGGMSKCVSSKCDKRLQIGGKTRKIYKLVKY
jgi:hypothetical protein